MTAPTPLPKLKKPLGRRLLKWTFRTLIVLVVLAIAAYAITSYWAAKTIHNEIARIRAAGEPLTFADLNAQTPKVDSAQDAGPYYAAAAELTHLDFETDNDTDYNAVYRSDAGKISPEVLARAQHSLELNRLALELLDQGSALPGCNSDIQLEYGIDAAVLHLGKMRRLCNVASLRTRVLTLENHGDGAVQSIISSLRLLRTLDRQPVIIAAFTQLAMLSRSCGDARFLLERGHLSDAALQELLDAMQKAHFAQPRQMYLAERVYFLEVSRDLIAGGRDTELDNGDNLPLPEQYQWSKLGITGRIMAARTLPLWSGYIDAVSSDWPAILTQTQNIAEKPESKWDHFGVSGPSVVLSMVTYARCLSNHRATLIAIQIERFRLAHAGQLPDSLAQLPNAHDFLKDPFTGSNLLYIKTPDGYCIFSAGRGHPEDSKVDRDKDPIKWSEGWGIHIRIPAP